MTVRNRALQFAQKFLSRTNKGPSIHKAVDCYSTIYEKFTSLTSACYYAFMIVSPPLHHVAKLSTVGIVVNQFPKNLNLQTHNIYQAFTLPSCTFSSNL